LRNWRRGSIVLLEISDEIFSSSGNGLDAKLKEIED